MHPQPKRELRHEHAVIYVPRAGSRLDRHIDPGSGIVGVPSAAGGRIVLYYEGNRIQASNLETPEERIICAFGRAAVGYPTVAMSAVLDDDVFDLVRVGTVSWPNVIRWDSPASLQVFQEYQSRAPGAGGSSLRPGLSGLSMVEFNMTDVLGEYDNPRGFEEWRWIEANASFEHVENGVAPGLFEFLVRIPAKIDEEDFETPPPPKVQAVIDLARQAGVTWILFHQG